MMPMLERYVKKVPDLAYDIMDLSEKPVTIVYDHPVGIANNLIAEDNTLGHPGITRSFCQRLIQRFKKPLGINFC